MASLIALDGQLADWTPVDRLDFGVPGVDGFKIYGRVVDGTYHFAIDSSSVAIGANSTIWLNTDQNLETGYKIFGSHLGADYKIEFKPDPNAPFGAHPGLYTVAADGTETLVEGGLSYAYSPDGKIIELALDKTKIPATPAMSALIDINDTSFVPNPYSQGQFTVKDELPPVRTDTTLKVAIVFSQTSADKYFSATAYSQLIMAAQSQAAAAGIPFDLLTENDLTNLSKVVNYDAIIFPSFGFVQKDKLTAIENVLTSAVYKYGISLVAAGNFMTNDETGAALSGDAYARMKSLLGVERIGGSNVAEVTVTGSSDSGAHIIGYGEGEPIRTYSQTGAALVGTAWFSGVSNGTSQVLATQSASDGTHDAVLATQTGSNNVFFATEGMMADSNMLQHAIGWAAGALESPQLKLQMGRQTSLFASRTDMDQSQEVNDVRNGIYDKLLPILQQWKTEFNFVGSYYVNIGNNPSDGQMTDWAKSKPFYDQLLAMGNEIGTHSYTHPEDTNILSPEQIEFEFNQSKLLLQEKLGITIQGAAVPGAPETLATSQLIGQYFSYISGGYTGVGAGYPSAFGYITPGSNSVYLAPNLKFDFSMVEAEPQFGGGLTPEQAKQEWIKQFEELSLKSDLPVFVWPWHDYGPTQWVINGGASSPYTKEMYTDFLRYAYQHDAEFVTMLDLAQRIKAFEQASFNYSFDSASNTITATVTANQIGTFALDVEEGKTIGSVSDWYAYDNDSVFMDTDGGTYKIKLGSTPDDVTHITSLPSRAQLLSVTGDGTNLNFSLRGEGNIIIDLTDPKGRLVKVAGAEIVSLNVDRLELKVSGDKEHLVSVELVPPAGNKAPTAVSLVNPVLSTPENGAALKVADIAVVDDGLGTNTLSL
ncbi:polysaccharide deacetylase family protein, partial [Microvirga calopogonii]|uniref:polysaccharide deacetylase family protein n=1 Tax=Microvirga calopogonii TaxID=2078013 RepID=UPI0013B46BD2